MHLIKNGYNNNVIFNAFKRTITKVYDKLTNEIALSIRNKVNFIETFKVPYPECAKIFKKRYFEIVT